jgi:hypothetical protein
MHRTFGMNQRHHQAEIGSSELPSAGQWLRSRHATMGKSPKAVGFLAICRHCQNAPAEVRGVPPDRTIHAAVELTSVVP